MALWALENLLHYCKLPIISFLKNKLSFTFPGVIINPVTIGIGERWVSGYEPFDRSEEGQYVQRDYTANVLKNIAQLNGSVLSKVILFMPMNH
jgi:hypothetical protein